MPTNPGSLFAQEMTSALATLVAAWNSSLTQPDRDGWDTWATNTSPSMTGLNAFIKMNSPKIQNGIGYNAGAPALFTSAPLTTPVLTIADVSAQTFTFTFTNTDEWANEAGGYLNFYASRPQNPGIKFFKGPYRFCQVILGDPAPPTSPQVTTAVNTPFPFSLGQRLFVRWRAGLDDGRQSASAFGSVLATA